MQEEYSSNEFYHSGVKGMKWGVRRYQNKDGTLNRRGMKKAAKMKKKYTAMTNKQLRRIPTKKPSIPPNKKMSEMTDDELARAVRRKQLEAQYASFQPKHVNVGKKAAGLVFDKVVVPVAVDAGKKVVNKMLGMPMQEEKSNKKKKVRVYQ